VAVEGVVDATTALVGIPTHWRGKRTMGDSARRTGQWGGSNVWSCCQVMSCWSREMMPQIHDLMTLSIRSQARTSTYVIVERVTREGEQDIIAPPDIVHEGEVQHDRDERTDVLHTGSLDMDVGDDDNLVIIVR
jgi:hypothetical protein